MTTNTGSTTKVENTPPPQFDANGIPIIHPNSRGQLDYYRNLAVYTKPNLTEQQITEVAKEIESIGTLSYYRSGVFIVQRVKVESIELLKRDSRIDVVYQMKLDFGWSTKTKTTTNLTTIQAVNTNNTSD
jgi:hypothetical protein